MINIQLITELVVFWTWRLTGQSLALRAGFDEEWVLCSSAADETGLVPLNCLLVVEGIPAHLPICEAANGEALGTSNSNDTPGPQFTAGPRAISKFTFEAEGSNNLGLVKGQSVAIRDGDIGDGWTICSTFSGKTGLVPTSYLLAISL
jgi:hypothetical protein